MHLSTNSTRDYNNPVVPKKRIPGYYCIIYNPWLFKFKFSTKTCLTKRNTFFKKIIIFTILGLFFIILENI